MPNDWGEFQHINALERNNFRMGNYHRLDLGANMHFPLNPGLLTLNFSVYNIYNHNNPFLVYTGYVYNESTQQAEKKLMQVSIFPIIPSFSLSYKF